MARAATGPLVDPSPWPSQPACRYARELDAALAAARQMRAGGADAAAAAQVAWGSKEDSVLRYDSMEEYAELADALQFWEDWRVSCVCGQDRRMCTCCSS